MPDWSYQTLFRPLLFRLQAERARTLTLGAMGRLSRLPLGPQLIEFLGHMRPPERLAITLGGVDCATPIGLDAALDADLLGLRPLSQFGFGWIEAGPVTELPLEGESMRRALGQEAIWYPDLPVNRGLPYVQAQLEQAGARVPLGVRLAHAPGASPEMAAAERLRLMEALAEHAAFFTLETRAPWNESEWEAHLRQVMNRALRPEFLSLLPDTDLPRAMMLVRAGLPYGIAGVMISGGVAWEGGRLEGPPAREPALALLKGLRERFGPALPVVAGGGIHEPADALAFLEAGATAVQVHAGLVYSGPGLPKRINEAIAHRCQQGEPVVASSDRGRGWAPAALMALGIFLGAALATWIALTRVVLPYDEAFVGLTRAQLEALNPRLLHFMEHDRISLSGTMVASALLYFAIALFAWRRGEHWARPAFLIPATLGFISFFLYPVHGYLEPLHALFYLALLPFFLAAVWQRQRSEPAAMPTSLRNDRAWRLGQWGQLLWIVLAAGGTVAGLTITGVGLTRVFVPEDLAYLGTTAETLGAVPRLVPLIAHDRVGFGTALTCNGITVLLMALWGYRRGARWLWYTFALAGVPSYVAAFGTHFAVGYVDWWHLTPPLVGLGLLLGALLCSYPYLTSDSW